ncbi:MAG: hypothetical protein H7Y42_14595 [Chitinophagaceae bacterium]|nr:hypothetical protein [Chitinophagaceae bacterium]
MKSQIIIAMLLLAMQAHSQVKIGDNPGSINVNALLELESTNKGFLPPRVSLNDASLVAPLTGVVPTGMLVFSSAGTLADGYYYWNGSSWQQLSVPGSMVTKSASTTLTKTETFVLATNDITITLPVITLSDKGLQITIKNVGAHTDLIKIAGNSGEMIDGLDSMTLTRHCSQTFVASAMGWVVKDRRLGAQNLMDVNSKSSWTTLQEAIEYLELHMDAPTVIRLGEESYDIDATLVIDLPFPLTLQGLSYGSTTIGASAGLANKPMFRCISDCYFKMLQFDATTLPSYGTLPGEDAIRFVGNDTYNEIKDCTFDSFYNTILDSTNAEIWVFETDISNAKNNGILIHSAEDSVIVKVAETDFIDCKRGINMSKGSSATVQLASGGYYNLNATDTAIVYRPNTFVSFINISLTGNSWNHAGSFIEGFDFSRIDGRDKNAKLESNAGIGDKKPYCFINVLNSSTNKTLTTANIWYKADWGGNTDSTTCKWAISRNRITYQPDNRRNGLFTIAGNLSVSNNNTNISIGIVRNGNSATRFGETTLRTTTANQPYQFSFVVYLDNIGPGDYFEIYYSSVNGGDVVKIQDIQWLVNTQ